MKPIFDFHNGDIYLREMLLQIGLADPEEGLPIGVIMRDSPSINGASGLSRASVWRRLSDACESGLIRQIEPEVRRRTVYCASDELRRAAILYHLRTRPESRETVQYDHTLLESYVPNQDSYLRQSELNRLYAQCPPGTLKREAVPDREMRRFMTDFAYASSKLEGVDYGLANTRSLLEEDDVTLGTMSPRDRQILLNHYEATRFLLDGIHTPPQEHDVAVSAHDVRSLHAILSNNMLRDSRAQGAIRKGPVKIAGSSYMPLAVTHELERLFNLAMLKASKIREPYEAAMFLLVHLPYLQPFVDCNKRTARLACNIPLIRSGVLPLSWIDTDSDEFSLAVMAVYEKQETRLLAELFTEACSRSFENFTLTRQEREPETIDLTYSVELRAAVRERFNSDSLTVPDTVAAEDTGAFETRVDEVISSIVENPFVGAAFGIRLPAVQRFVERNPALTTEYER